MADERPPFLRIPIEIRLLIYDLLLNDYGQKVFEIRNEDPADYKHRKPHLRGSYRVLGRDLIRQSIPTTYRLVTETDMQTSIMAVSQQIYSETAHILYRNRMFDFGRDIEAIVPFFSDLTRCTRPFVQEVSLVKQGFVYSRDYDRCEWTSVCDYLREHMQISSLDLVIEGGRPALGWDNLPKYAAADFKTLSTVKYELLEWVWELLSIKGLQKLEVHSSIHRVPLSHSIAMTFFAAFSATIETGFADFLRSEMIGN